MKKRIISIALVLVMALSLLTVSASAYTSIKLRQSVSGVLDYSSTYAEYKLSGMNVSEYWGIRLTATITGTNNYEMFLTEGTLGSFGIDINYSAVLRPGTNEAGFKPTSTGFIYETPIVKYAIDEYVYQLSIPDYFWEDDTRSAKIAYSLELYQQGSGVEQPSGWAAAEVNAAIAAGLVPSSLQKNYTQAISRLDCMKMFINLLEKASGKSIDTILSDKGVSRNYNKFTDTSDSDVLAANALGIIEGDGGSLFSPYNTLTRAQIAAIMCRMANVMGIYTSGYSHGFSDARNHWVSKELGWPVAEGIIKGTSGTTFNPDGTLTVEQAISVSYRAVAPLSEGTGTGTVTKLETGLYICDKSESTQSEYFPTIEILPNNKYTITGNYYEGMASFEGTYSCSGSTATFSIPSTYRDWFTDRYGQSPKPASFKMGIGNGSLTYLESLYFGMTEYGDVFKLS